MYEIRILPRAAKSLARLPTDDYDQVVAAIRSLSADPRPVGCRKLAGRNGWRIRVGVYRVIYEIEDAVKILIVLDVGHRKDIYRS